MRCTCFSGWSLLELLVVLSIVGILSGIGYSGYQHHLVRARRVDGQASLLALASAVEAYRLQHMRVMGVAPSFAGWSAEGHYKLSVTSADDLEHYVLQANAVGWQLSHDPKCATLELDDLGQRSAIDKSKREVEGCW